MDEREGLLEQLPPLTSVLVINDERLEEVLMHVPDAQNEIIRLVDGARTIEEVVGEREKDEVGTLKALVLLYFVGVVKEAGRDSIPVSIHPFDESPELQIGGNNTISGPAPSTPQIRVDRPNRVGAMLGAMGNNGSSAEGAIAAVGRWRTRIPQVVEEIFEDIKNDPRVTDAIGKLDSSDEDNAIVRDERLRAHPPFVDGSEAKIDLPPPSVSYEEIVESSGGLTLSSRFAMVFAGGIGVVALLAMLYVGRNDPTDPTMRSASVADLTPVAVVPRTPEDELAVQELAVPQIPAQSEPVNLEIPVAQEEEVPAMPTATSDDFMSYEGLLAKAKDTRASWARETLYVEAVEANPQGAEALSGLAFMLLNRGVNNDAASYALRAVKIDPTDSRAWVTLGAARQQLRDREGAKEAYRSCVEFGQGKFVADCRSMIR